MNWNDLLKPELIWITIGLLLMLSEFAIPGLVAFFFGAGAILTGLLCLAFDLSLNLQLVIFLGSSVALLFALRRFFADAFTGTSTHEEGQPVDLEEILGEHAIVVQAIRPNFGGKVEFHGTRWNATAKEDIAVDTPVEIIDRHNLDLIVKPL